MTRVASFLLLVCASLLLVGAAAALGWLIYHSLGTAAVVAYVMIVALLSAAYAYGKAVEQRKADGDR